MKFCIISISFLCALIQLVSAQETDSLVIENIPADTVLFIPVITSRETRTEIYPDTLMKPKFSPNPTKAVIFSAIFPGMGQVYNRKYWKLPLVYGGFMGCMYAISFNSRYYKDYSQAYLDFTDKDESTKSWDNFTHGPVSDSTWFAGVLKRKKDFYRRNRDLSYIITAGLYVICMIDAYVDAQLFDFDISQDLSLRVEPAIFERTSYNRRSFGLQCSFTF